jgi:branched-subunit amino acid aminotransferase/4-amino-4-deoxychorismate lyase
VPVLIETVRVHDGQAPLWPLHRARVTRSARLLGIDLPALTPPAGGSDRVVRFAIAAGGVTVTEREVGSVAPVNLVTSPAPHRGYPHKVADRGWLAAARHGVQPVGADDALLLDRDGRLVEATMWAVGWWDGDRLCFPPLELGGLPSVARDRLDEAVRGGVQEVALFREQLAWRALVVCNAARGLVPVATLDGEPVPGNHRTRALASRFWDRELA